MRRRLIVIAIALLAVCPKAYPQEHYIKLKETLKVETPMFTAPLLHDSLLWQPDVQAGGVFSSTFAPTLSPDLSPTRTSGSIFTWSKGAIVGESQQDNMIGLMGRRRVAASFGQRYGNLTLTVGLSASKYALPVDGRLPMLGLGAVQNQFGISGAVTYDFTSHVSATVYGQYVTNPFYHSMAAFPYVSTSSYGGYVTLHGSNMGLGLGVNNHYDPFARRWHTDPIIRPAVKIGKIKAEFDVGPLVKDAMLRLTGKKRYQGPIIAPDM